MTTTYTKKRNKRYRYYICQSKVSGKNEECEIGRVSASEIEDIVINQILKLLQKPEFVAGTINQATSDPDLPNNINENTIINSFRQIGKVWDELFLQEQARIVSLLVEGVSIKSDGINIRIFKEGIGSLSDELNIN